MEQFLRVQIDASSAQNVLGALNVKLRGLEPLLDEFCEVIEDTIEHGFETQTDPTGSPWAELAPSILRRRRQLGQGNNKLIATGAGKASIRVTRRGNQAIVSFADYMRFHQTGTRYMAQRRFAPIADDIETGELGEQLRIRTHHYLSPSVGRFIQQQVRYLPVLGRPSSIRR